MAVCLRGSRGSAVCPAREKSGLKGSLSTYTLAENQSINRGCGEGRDEGLNKEKRSGAGREKVSRLLWGPAKLSKICNSIHRDFIRGFTSVKSICVPYVYGHILKDSPLIICACVCVCGVGVLCQAIQHPPLFT